MKAGWGRTKLLRALIALLALGLAWQPLLDLLTLIGDLAAVSVYLKNSGAWGPILLALIQLLQVLFVVMPGHVFMVIGGYVYGFTGGFVINLVSTVGASQLTFALARRAGRPVVNRMVPASVLGRWNKVAERQGFVFFLFSFLLPMFPCDAMNFVAGLSSISPWHFLAANFLGRLPIVTLLTLIGSHGLELAPQVWTVIPLGVASLFLAWRYCIPKHAALF